MDLHMQQRKSQRCLRKFRLQCVCHTLHLASILGRCGGRGDGRMLAMSDMQHTKRLSRTRGDSHPHTACICTVCT